MFSIRNLSIKNKLIWMQVFTCVLVLGLCFVAFVASDIRGYKERKVNSTVSIAQVIGSNSISALQFLDNDAALKILKQVEPDVMNAAILDKKGNLFAGYTRIKSTPYNFKGPLADNYRFAGDFLYVYKNIIKDNEVYGTVCLQIQLTELEQIINQKIIIGAILLIVGITLAFVIAIINQRYISKPLISLITIIDSIRESGDYNRHVPVKGKDEIAKLSLEFNNLMDQVNVSNQRKDEFIGIASHELKTPLTIIKGFLEMLDDADLDKENKFFVDKALNSTNKLQNLIFDLLDVSRIQSGQLQLNIQEFDIDELIDECISNIKLNTESHPIVKATDEKGQMVYADRNRIEQVIINLLTNAIKYSPEGKSIIVATKETLSTIIVSIKDSGMGLPKTEQERVFDRFYRSNESNIGTSGFGLGLYICAQIIKRHNGKIWVESEEGNGSTFYFELVLKNEA